MYRTRQAAKYVGMKFSTFVYHIAEGHLKEKFRVRGERVFDKEILDTFKREYISDLGMNKEDIARVYGQEIPVVRGQLRRKQLEPIAKHGKSHRYSTVDVERLAKSLGWTKQIVDSDGDPVSAQSADNLAQS